MEIRINHAALDTAAADMRSSIARMDERLGSLESQLAPLRSDWQGNAQDSYRTAKLRWDTAIKEMQQLLSDTEVSTLRSNEEYRSADRRGASKFQL